MTRYVRCVCACMFADILKYYRMSYMLVIAENVYQANDYYYFEGHSLIYRWDLLKITYHLTCLYVCMRCATMRRLFCFQWCLVLTVFAIPRNSLRDRVSVLVGCWWYCLLHITILMIHSFELYLIQGIMSFIFLTTS